MQKDKTKRRFKLWHKIIAGIVFFILLLIILITPVLNYYLKKTILSTMNATINADFKIEKLRLRLLKSEIEIYGIEINEKHSENNENLLSIRKISIALNDFNRKNGQLIIDELKICSADINLITLEDGTDLWSTIIKPSQKQVTDTLPKDVFDKFGIMIENTEILALNIRKIDRKNNSEHYLSDIHLSAQASKKDESVYIEYFIHGDYRIENEDSESFSTISLEGNLLHSKNLKSIMVDNLIMINRIPVYFDIELYYAKNSGKASKLRLNSEINYSNEENHYQGGLSADINISGVFDSIPHTNIQAIFDVNDLYFSNLKSEDEDLFADFNLKINYCDSDSLLYSIEAERFLIKLGKDSIFGNSTLIFNDYAFIADNNINGKLELTNLKSFVGNKYSIEDGVLEISSDLNGLTDNNTYSLRGSHYFAFRNLKINSGNKPHLIAENFVFNIEKGDLIFNNDVIFKELSFTNDLYINNIQSFYSDKVTFLSIDSYISKIAFPSSGKRSFSLPRRAETEKEVDYFPENFHLDLRFIADSIISGENILSNLNINLIYSPALIKISDYHSELAGGVLKGDIELRKFPDYTTTKTNIAAKNIDLKYYEDAENGLSGFISVNMINDIISFKDDCSGNNYSNGINTLHLKDFSINTGRAARFGLNADNLKIDSLFMTVRVSGEKFIIEPFSANLNNIIFTNSGEIIPSKDTMSVRSFIRIPRDELDRKGRLAIRAMTESKYTPLKLDENYINLLLEIYGSPSIPEYDLYELKTGR